MDRWTNGQTGLQTDKNLLLKIYTNLLTDWQTPTVRQFDRWITDRYTDSQHGSKAGQQGGGEVGRRAGRCGRR
jgi:phage gp46-like protein